MDYKAQAIEYLRNKEWSMGNGQCPECHGVPESWFGHPCHMTPESIGHEKHCALVPVMKSLGLHPLMKGDFTSEVEYEPCFDEDGLFGTRIKQDIPCPRYAERNAKARKRLQKAFLDALRSTESPPKQTERT